MMRMQGMEQYIVTKSNDLVEARYSLSTHEQRIVLILASKVQPQDNEFKRYQFSVKEFADLLGIKSKSIYQDLQNITSGLLKKTFTIIKERSESNAKSDRSVLQINWLASAEYFEGKGLIELEFSPKLKPYFLQLKERFTSYKLQDVIKLKSSHSFRFYELLKQYETIGHRTFRLEELKKTLDIASTEYPKYANFKQKVLLVAQKEISEKTDLSFEFEEIKTSRKVEKLKFMIYGRQRIYPVEPPEHLLLVERLEKDFGIKKPQIQKIMRTYELDYIEDNLAVIEEAIYHGKVKNIPAYTLSALKDDYRRTMTSFEIEQLRAQKLQEDKERMWELRDNYNRLRVKRIKDLKKNLDQETLYRHINEFMHKFPEYHTIFIEEILDTNLSAGQIFEVYLLDLYYPNYSFHDYLQELNAI